MSWLSDRLKEAVPYAMAALPFTPWGAGLGALMQTKAPWMARMMNSKIMNSVLGASAKDAAISYTMAELQGKENPHLIAKNALLRGMFVNANKVGFDPNLMMGGDPTTLPALDDRVIDAMPGKMGTRITPDYTEYGQDMMDKYYGPGRGGQDLNPYYGEFMGPEDYGQYFDPMTVDKANKITGGGWNKLDPITKSFDPVEIAAEAPEPIRFFEEPAQEALTIPGEDIQGPITKTMMADVKNPLAGMGFLTTTKTQPSMLDKLLGRGKDLKELGIKAGTPEYDEYFGIGETRADMAKMLGLGMDYFSDPLTDPQKERKEQEEYERKMARLMYPRTMADVYGFEDKFLGNQGGLASLANGGRIGYQGGGIGPAGATLEETPMAARKEVTIKSQLEDLYKLYMEKGLLTPGLAKMFGWDDPNEYYNNEIWQRDFGDPLNANVGPEGNILNQTAMDPEGAGPMTPMTPYPDDDDFRFDEGTIGPNPTFEDEFGGYLDLASGPDNQGMYDAYEDYKMDGGTLNFEDWKISIQEVMNPEDWAAARGGRLNAKDGLWANIHAKRKRIAGGSGEKMRSPGSTGAPTNEALKQSQATGGVMGYYGGGELNAIPGGMISGPGTETSDSIPAQLSNNEFVVTADAVRAAGGGDIDLGAQKFYGIMNALDPNSAKLGEPPVYS